MANREIRVRARARRRVIEPLHGAQAERIEVFDSRGLQRLSRRALQRRQVIRVRGRDDKGHDAGAVLAGNGCPDSRATGQPPPPAVEEVGRGIRCVVRAPDRRHQHQARCRSRVREVDARGLPRRHDRRRADRPSGHPPEARSNRRHRAGVYATAHDQHGGSRHVVRRDESAQLRATQGPELATTGLVRVRMPGTPHGHGDRRSVVAELVLLGHDIALAREHRVV